MKFILLFGPPAVGKMTVGKELEKITGLKVFHNHMTIEPVLPFFDFGTQAHNRLVTLFREQVLKEIAKSSLPGVIFTLVWAFDISADAQYVNKFVRIFKNVGAKIYYVELEANLKERIKRNKSALRLEHKPSKRNIKKTEKILLEHEQMHRFNTREGEFRRKNYLKINNTRLGPAKVARIIKEKFKL